MKRLFSVVAVLGICALSAQAQAISFTVRPMFGYGIGTGKQAVGTDTKFDDSGDKTKNENLYYSAGSGLKFGIGFDADLTQHLAFGLDLGYSYGLTAEIQKGSFMDATLRRETKTSFLPISITLKTKSKHDELTIFAGLGPTLLISPKSMQTNSAGNGEFKSELETTFRTGLGYHGLAGMEYGILENIVLFAQARIDQVSIKKDKMKVTKATLNGVDVLDDYTTREKNIIYVEDDTKDDPSNTGVPEIANTEVFPANSFTFSIGFGLRF